MGSGMVTRSSSRLQLAAITPIFSRPGGVANLGNGANDIIRAYSPGGRAHDIADTQDGTGTLTHQPLYSGADHFTLNIVDRLRERTLTPEWRRCDHAGYRTTCDCH